MDAQRRIRVGAISALAPEYWGQRIGALLRAGTLPPRADGRLAHALTVASFPR